MGLWMNIVAEKKTYFKNNLFLKIVFLHLWLSSAALTDLSYTGKHSRIS